MPQHRILRIPTVPQIVSPLFLALSCASGQAAEAEPTIVVTAPRETTAPTNLDQEAIEHEIEMTPGGVTLVDGADFTHRQVGHLGDALRFVPGFWVTSHSGASALTLSARGSNLDSKGYDQNGVRMLEDGLPTSSADGNNHNRFISPLLVRRAVVARGANSLEYGGSTLGGTVNVITPTAYDSAPLRGFVSGGSHGSFTVFGSASHVFDGGLDAMVTVESRTREGYRDHSEEQQVGVYANAGFCLHDTISTRLYLSALHHEQELPGALTREQVEEDRDQAGTWAQPGQTALDVEAFRLASKTTFRFAGTERLDLGISYEHQEIFHPILAQHQFFSGYPGLILERDHDDIWLTARYAVTWAAHELVIGANYGLSQADGSTFANEAGSSGALLRTVEWDAATIELYASDRWRLTEEWLVVVGVQAVFASREIANFDAAGNPTTHPRADYTGVSPRIGLIWRFADDSEAFVSIGRLFEPPTLFQVDDEAGAGNETLHAMSGTNWEFGGRGMAELPYGGTVNWEATLYYALIDDEILTVEEPPGSGDTLTGNVDRTSHAGIELAVGGTVALTGQTAHLLAPRVSLTINRFRFHDHALYGDNDLPGAPDYSLRAELLYRHASGWYGGPTVDLVGPSSADFENSYAIDDYMLLGLRGGYESERWSAFVEMRNLLDEDHIATSAVSAAATAGSAILYPGEPRSVYAGVAASW